MALANMGFKDQNWSHFGKKEKREEEEEEEKLTCLRYFVSVI